MSTSRREFISTAIAAGAVTLIAPHGAQGPESRIEVLVNEPIGTISPNIYSHFVEHLGGVVYDGIWVGENSKVPNIGGIRRDLVEHVKRIKPGVIRWPGGCFADQYDWRDGVGPRKNRPRRTNFWVDAPEWPKGAAKNGPHLYEPNTFGTIEFARFCRAVGAQPYFAANVRSLPARDFWQWVEYCNSPAGSTTLADSRAADGEAAPLNVRFWGVGNESWGCGGNFTPEDYASEYRRYSAWLPSYGVPLALVGSGPNDENVAWTRRFFSKMAQNGGVGSLWGWGLHHYSWNASGGRTTDWQKGKRDALKFDDEQYYEILREADRTEPIIEAHWAVMGESDPRHRVKLVVDEWGSWYAGGTEPFAEALIGQQNTMRDALLAGLTLDIFNRHADKVAMANIAQLVNCLQSLFFAHEDKFAVTPTYHVFDLYSAHQGAKSVRTLASSPNVRYMCNGAAASMRGLNGSASLQGSVLTLTVTNPSLRETRETEVAVRGAKISGAAAWALAEADPQAHNSFSDPRAVQPKQVKPTLRNGAVMHAFPPASVTKIELTLA
jgi:alpha-N-arabinofuranosidase